MCEADMVRDILKDTKKDMKNLKHYIYLISRANEDENYFNPQIENVLIEIRKDFEDIGL